MLSQLRKVLQNEGMALKTVAKFLGITEKTLSNKIKGSSEFTMSEARNIKKLLPKYDVDYLLYPDPPDKAG